MNIEIKGITNMHQLECIAIWLNQNLVTITCMSLFSSVSVSGATITKIEPHKLIVEC